MTDILVPPSPSAHHTLTTPSEDYSAYYFHSNNHRAACSSQSRDTPYVTPSWSGLETIRRFSVPTHNLPTPPSTGKPQFDEARNPMLQSHLGPLTGQSHVSARLPLYANQPPQQIPQLPAPQPHVSYQPVPSAAAEQVTQRDDPSKAENNQIATYMQIPASINGSRGSLAEFAAQITCLFWFESINILQKVEDGGAAPVPHEPLAADAKPTTGFRKWVTTMLSTTQVTQNVILLALMFIYRLKEQNPQVRGKAGSEYRLLTVALMLGNKFLDDNTYTNKTWADVSGISVAEIHVMEVEFLSNMRYTLYTSEEDWTLWHKKLGRFYDYFEAASRSASLPVLMNSASEYFRTNIPHLPSPTPNGHLLQHYAPPSRPPSPPYLGSNSPLYRPPQLPPPMAERVLHISPPLQPSESRPGSRKRSYEEVMDEPTAKRSRGSAASSASSSIGTLQYTPNASTPSNSSSYMDTPADPYSSHTSYLENQIPRLPLPNVGHHSQSQAMPNPAHNANNLPPPLPRSMAMVYPSQSNHPNQLSIPQTAASNGHRISIPSIFDHAQGGIPPQLHPLSTGSPSNLALTSTSHELLSPSGYPLNRSSPYRPIRSVNTLLVPPQPSTVQTAPSNVGSTNMHYQPIGRPTSERRTGVVPYMHYDRSPWTNPYPPYSQGPS